MTREKGKLDSAEVSEALSVVARDLADRIDHIAEKVGRRVAELHETIVSVGDTLEAQAADVEEVKSGLQDLVGRLQFEDILRQELETIESALRSLSGSLDNSPEGLLRALWAFDPRCDIDAEDAEDAGERIELF